MKNTAGSCIYLWNIF